jgi:peptidyl-prolyl cis-trans isomerase B (cyclophilin B)
MERTLSHEEERSAQPGRPRLRASRLAPSLAAAWLLGLPLACGAPGETPSSETAAAADTAAAPESSAPFAWPEGPRPIVTLELSGRDDIVLELYPEIAPKTVDNFIRLASEGFYDGTTFHRVMPGFMIQGGDPNTRNNDPSDDGMGGPGYKLADEPNPAPHERGTLSMANSGTPNSGGSQFFIVHEDVRHLDGAHTAFGRVRAGMDVVDSIAEVETDVHGRWGPRHRPIENVRVERVTVTGTTPGAGLASEPAAPPEAADLPAGGGPGDSAGGPNEDGDERG